MEIIAFIYLVRRDKALKVTTQGVAHSEHADLAGELHFVCFSLPLTPF